MDKTVERLTLVVSEQGFAFARVRPRAARDPAARAINVTYVIDEGPRVYIERINIIGNSRTHDYVIRREFRLAEGDAYNPLMVDKAKKRLQDLGFFKTVEIKRRPGSAPDRVILDVELVEQSTGELSFGAGYSTSEGVIGDVSITERNLLGSGQFLRLRLAGSAERMQIDSELHRAALPRSQPGGRLRPVPQGRQPVGSRQPSARRTTGGSVRLGFPLVGEPLADQQLHASRNEIYRRPGWVRRARSRKRQASLGRHRSAPASSYDTRNHPKNPTQRLLPQAGANSRASAATCSTSRYGAEARYYYPITEKITFVGRAIGGHIEGWGGEDVRLIDLFYKGGETIRGFNRGGFGPRDLLHERRARRRHLLGDHGGSALPAAVHAR